MKVNTPKSVECVKTFYNFVMLPEKQRHNISESVSLILVPKSGKFQTCAGRATTLVTVIAISSDIAYPVWGIVYSSAHRFSRASERMNGQAPHFRFIG